MIGARGPLAAGAALCALLAGLMPTQARAWDAGTHRLITELAIDALPAGSLKDSFKANARRLAALSVEPDTRLKKLYGKVEERRHYIDLENYGKDPFAVIGEDRKALQARFSARQVEHWGTLPWTIDELSSRLERAFAKKDRAEILRLAGHLCHYVGDSTQPLHSTKHWDGDPQDRGLHARLELAADHDAKDLERLARPAIEVHEPSSVWQATVDELRHSHGLVNEVIDQDRAARDSQPNSEKAQELALLDRERPLIASQVARGASLLASIWVYEWHHAGSPTLK